MLKNNNIPKIFIDAMGGDFAPEQIILGVLQAQDNLNIRAILVGNEIIIRDMALKKGLSLEGLEIINTSQEVKMDDSPSDVLRNKTGSSIYIAAKLSSETENSAYMSAGNTGAAMACSLFNMKKIEGIYRPAIAVVVPLGEKKFVLIDAGANTEIKPVFLKQFALMGKVYAQEILKKPDPRIGILNVGSEEKKGTEITIEGYKILKESNVNFIGNVEGRDLFDGIADVVVTDGFTGNILLKSFEGMAKFFFDEIKNMFYSSFFTKISALIVKKQLKALKKRFDYEEYGGALLLGVNGVSVISHGSSRAKAIKNAIRVAAESLKGNIPGKIKEEVKS